MSEEPKAPRILLGGHPIEVTLEQEGSAVYVRVRWQKYDQRKRVPRTILELEEDQVAQRCADVAQPMVERLHAQVNRGGLRRIKVNDA